MTKGAIIVVAGPGLGGALALRLAVDGYDVGLVGVDPNAMDELTA
jgi:NAD(P)-dependent dehydrogenase (short-subunit alcohol dehydrogenase family)